MKLAACKVTDQGIAHLFMPFKFGARCVCGRKIVYADEEDKLQTQDTSLPSAAWRSTS
jgi:hypothetical protein